MIIKELVSALYYSQSDRSSIKVHFFRLSNKELLFNPIFVIFVHKLLIKITLQRKDLINLIFRVQHYKFT